MSVADSGSGVAEIDAFEDDRLAVGLLLDRLAAARPAVGNDIAAQLVLASVSLGNSEGFDDDPKILDEWSAAERPAPDRLRRPVSGYSVALRLGFSRETVRRKLLRLSRQGLIVWSGDGYLVPSEAISTPLFQQAARDAFRQGGDYFRDMERLGLVGPELAEAARRERPKLRLAGRALNTFAIEVIEAVGRLTKGDLKETLLFCAIFRQTAYLAPAESGARARRGPNAVTLAAELGLSRETARRHVRVLEAAGLVVDGPLGLRVPAAVLQSQRLQGALQRARQGRPLFLKRLAKAGVLAQS